MRKNWSNAFRMSAELDEDVDPKILQQAADAMTKRFPSFFVRLRRGFFWYYLQKSVKPVQVRMDYAYPLVHMGVRELSDNCLRILYYRNRIAVEFFHSLTDGHGGSVFLSTLVAEYIRIKYGVVIEATDTVLDPNDKPSESELEDSFLKHTADAPMGRAEASAYRLSGTPLPDGFRYLITGKLSAGALVKKAHEYDCTVTAYLAAVMASAIIDMQAERKTRNKWKPVKITIPVDLRRLYGSCTMRNFALTLNPGVDPRFGNYTLRDLCASFSHQLALEAMPQKMAGMIAANVLPQKNLLIRLCPVAIKSLVMDIVYRMSGERNGCLNISNLGRVLLPENMMAHVRRMDFIVGNQRSYPNNCSVLSLGDTVCINMIRNIEESDLERRFFSKLVEEGLKVDIESNAR